MDDLVRWLTAQFDADERIARAAAKKVAAPPNDGMRWRRDWDTIHTAPSDPPGPRVKVADCGHGGGDVTAHIVAHDPARVLRDIDAHRKLLAEVFAYEAKVDGEWGCCHDADEIAAGLCEEIQPKDITALRLLASVYRDRPGFREEWRP